MKKDKIMSRKYKGSGLPLDWSGSFVTLSAFVCDSFKQRAQAGVPLAYSDYDVIIYLCMLVGVDEVELTTGYTRKEIKALREEVTALFPPDVIKGKK